MAKKTLNDTICRNASCPTGREDIFDALCSGLCLRVTANKKTWTFFYSPPGSKERARLALGTYPATSLDAARKRAEAARGQVEAGVDPRTIVAATAVAKPKTIAELCADRLLLEVRAKGQPEFRSADQIERRYKADIIPVIGHIAVRDFAVTHYNLVIDRINEREAFVVANRVHSDLRRLLKFAVRRGEREFSPISEFDPPHEETARERHLSISEIVHFWHQCPQALVRSPKVQAILKLLLVLGKRSDQVCGMRRTEVDLGKRLWTIPRERVKGTQKKAREEQVPLSDLAISILRPILASHNNEFVFPDDGGEGPYHPRVVSKAVDLALTVTVDRPKGRLGMDKWTPHDLRRTVGTQLLARDNGLGITKEQKYLVLNHTAELRKNVSDRVYDWNDYLPEKREALEKWGALLAQLVGIGTDLQVAA